MSDNPSVAVKKVEMSDNPYVAVLLSLSSFFVILAIVIGPIPNALTNCEKHQDLCAQRKNLFATLMYWALGFLVVYSFSTGTVFQSVKQLSSVPLTSGKQVIAVATEALKQGMASATAAAKEVMSTATQAAGSATKAAVPT